jgi:ABC-2 type transport system permease protein
MSVSTATVPRRPARRALRSLVASEGKLAWREPVGLVLGVGFPVMLLVIFGLSSGFQKRIVSTSPTTYRTVYVPILMALVLVLIALISLPIPIVVQRERKFLRRLSTTPVAPLWLLTAQVAVNLVLALVAMILIVTGSAVLFGVHPPSQVPGFILAALLATACLFGLGLVIAAVAPSERASGAIGSALIFPLMFFAGLWQPSQTVTPSVMQDISNLTPLGAAVHAMLRSMQGTFPTIGSVAVMAAWTVVFGIAAVKLFRWE